MIKVEDIIRLFISIFNLYSYDDQERLSYDDGLCNLSSTVCIVLDKGLGDFILFSHYLERAVSVLEVNGAKVTIVADSYSINFVSSYFPEYKDKIIQLKRDELVTVEGIKLSDYRGQYEVGIIPMAHLTPRSTKIVRILSPRRIYSVGKGLFIRGYSLRDYKVIKRVQAVCVCNSFYCDMHRNFWKNLLNEDFGVDINRLMDMDPITDDDFFLVNIDGGYSQSIDKSLMMHIADIISQHLGLKAYIIGSLNNIPSEFEGNDRIQISFLNKVNIFETAALCKQASFIITSNTGILHLALSVESHSKIYVITWGYENNLFIPYSNNLCNYDERVRLVQMFNTCQNCTYNKDICYVRRKMGKKVKCISNFDKYNIINMIISSYRQNEKIQHR